LPRKRLILLIAVILPCLPLLSGCAGVTLATLGSIAGATATAAQAGTEVYTLGKLDTAEMASQETAVNAVRLAADDLGLKLQPPEPRRNHDPSVEDFRFLDDKNTAISVRVEALTRSMVQMRIEVGIFGSEVSAHLFLTRVRAHLPRTRPSETRPGETRPGETRPGETRPVAISSQAPSPDGSDRSLLLGPAGGFPLDRPARLAKLGREEGGAVEPQVQDTGVGQVACSGLRLDAVQPDAGAQIGGRKTAVQAHRSERLVHQFVCFAGHCAHGTADSTRKTQLCARLPKIKKRIDRRFYLPPGGQW
jgi:hypothetical protein